MTGEYKYDLNEKLWYISGTLNEKICNTKRKMMLDTGANSSSVSKKVWLESGMPLIEEHDCTFYGIVPDVLFEIDGRAEFTIKIGSIEFTHNFLVAPKLPSCDVLIGLDLLQYTNAIFNIPKRLIILNGQSIPVMNENKQENFDIITVGEKQIVPKNSVTIVELQASGASDLKEGYLRVDHKFILKFNLLPVFCVVKVDEHQKTHLKLVNLTSNDVQLYPKTHVGSLVRFVECEKNTFWEPFNFKNNSKLEDLFEITKTLGKNHKLCKFLKKNDDIIYDKKLGSCDTSDSVDLADSSQNLVVKCVKICIGSKFLSCLDLRQIQSKESTPLTLVPIHESIYKAKYISLLKIGIDDKAYDVAESQIMSKLMRNPEIMFKILSLSLAPYSSLRNVFGLNTIVIHSFGFDEHLDELANSFKFIRNMQAKILPGSSMLFQSKVNFYGYELSSKGISVLEQDALYFAGFDAPNSASELISFVEIMQKYSSFIPHFSSMFNVINKAVQKADKFSWNPTRENAVNSFRESIKLFPTVIFPNTTPTLVVSVVGNSYSAVLICKEPSRRVACFSKEFSKKEKETCETLKLGVFVIKSLLHFKSFFEPENKVMIAVNEMNAIQSFMKEKFESTALINFQKKLQKLELDITSLENDAMIQLLKIKS